MAALGNAVGNRTVGNNTRDQNLFTLKKTHLILTFLTMDNGLDFSYSAKNFEVKGQGLALMRDD